MTKVLKIFLTIIILGLVMLAIYIYMENINMYNQALIKEKQISQLIKINRVNSKIIKDQDSIGKMRDNTIRTLNMKLNVYNDFPSKVSYSGFSLGDKNISTTELLSLFNKIYKENETNKLTLQILKKQFGITYSFDAKSIVTSYDSTSVISKLKKSEKENNKTISDLQKSKIELEIKAKTLQFIQRKYNIQYQIEDNIIRIPENKIDTLLDVYPIIKNRIKYDRDKNKVWIRGLIL